MLIDQEACRLQLSGLAITLDWVPAHVGTPGNESADKAAKEAAVLSGQSVLPVASETAIPRPYPLVHKIARVRSRTLQANAFAAAAVEEAPRLREVTGTDIYPPKPLVSILKAVAAANRIKQSPQLPRGVEVTLSRLRCGTEVRPSVLRRYRLVCDGSCPYCGTDNSYNYRHVILDCMYLDDKRQSLLDEFNKCKPIVPLTVSNILGFETLSSTNTRQAVMAIGRFLADTGLTDLLTVIPQPPD
jgi:hypothetical protein